MAAVLGNRARHLRTGVRLELATIAWMLIEAAVAIAAGLLARSILLTAFGFDSLIELASGGVLLWRLIVDARGASLARVETAERRASLIVGVLLATLCLYVVAFAVAGLALNVRPDASVPGLAITALALVVMPILVVGKRRVANRLDSAALRGDAACSVTCAYMAATALVGLALHAVFGWWWAEYAASLLLLYWLVPEAREALEAAAKGEARHDDCRDD
jgi:divalent metal cation (Fe/Co/Zn/Cd) transporter